MPPRRRHRKDPAPVTDLLRGLRPPAAAAGSAHASGGAPDLAVVVAAWPGAAGRDAARSVPVRMSRGGVVSVACADAGMAQAMSYREAALLSALEGAGIARLRALRFVVADHAVTFPQPPPERVPVAPGADARRVAQGLVAAAEDDRLRQALERAAAVSVQRSWDTR